MAQSDAWCPNGSEEQDPQPIACVGTINLDIAAAAAVLFPLGIPAEIASAMAGINWGTIISSKLCSMPPADPGPFPVASLITQMYTGFTDIVQWAALSIERFWWAQCCTCKPPPPPVGSKIADWTFANWAGGNLYVQPYNPNYGLASVIWVAGNVTNVGAAGTGYWQALAGHETPTTLHSCINGTAFNNQVQHACWGPGSAACNPHVNGAYGTQIVSADRFTTIASQDCIGIAVGKQGTTAPLISGNLQLWAQLTDPYTYPPTIYPPPTQPTGPSGGGSGSPTYPVNTGTLSPCNFAPISANTIERMIAPQSRVADGGVHHISGASVLAIPGGAIGWTVRLTAYPPGYSHDAGDPPQLYQVGWMAPSIDGVELSCAPQIIRSGQEQFWLIRPTDAYISYNLYPGFTADVQFWNTSTPT